METGPRFAGGLFHFYRTAIPHHRQDHMDWVSGGEVEAIKAIQPNQRTDAEKLASVST